MSSPPISIIGKVKCYLTDALVPVADVRRLILSDGAMRPATIQVQAHKDVLAFLTDKGDIQQLGNTYIAFV